jgi:aldehyde oxidoreductase
MTARDAQALQVVRLQLNRRPCELVADPARRLSDVLRDDLGLTGTKIGCHAGDCGACTVLLDDEQVCACLVALGACEARAVTTVEGLAADGEPSALQQAFIANGAPAPPGC